MCPIFSVPGKNLSFLINPVTFANNVVGAKLPIPNVSIKSVTKPITNPTIGFESSPTSPLFLIISNAHITIKYSADSPSNVNKIVTKFIFFHSYPNKNPYVSESSGS